MSQVGKILLPYFQNTNSFFVAFTDFKGNCQAVNELLIRCLNTENKEQAKHKFEEYFSPLLSPDNYIQLESGKKSLIEMPAEFITENEIRPTFWEITVYKSEEKYAYGLLWIGHLNKPMSTLHSDNSPQKESNRFFEDENYKLKALLDSSTDGSILISPEFKILSYNRTAQKSAEKYYNTKLDVGKDFRQYILEDTKEEFYTDFKKALNLEQTVKEKELLIRSEKIWFQCSFHPAIGANGQVIGVSFNSTNIDKRKRAEEKILENEKFLDSVLQAQHEMICRFLPDTTLTYVNNAYCNEMGYSKAELLGKKFLEFIPEELEVKILKNLKALNLKKPSQTMVHKSFDANGNPRWQEWTDTGLFDADGNLIEFQAVGRDITELIDSKRNLERFHSIFENSLHEIYLLHPEQLKITQANKAAAKNLKYSVDKLKNLSFYTVVNQPFKQKVKSEIQALLEGNKDKVSFESEHLRQSGSTYPIEIHLQKMCIDKELFLVAICVDLSERNSYIKSITEQNTALREIAWIQSHLVRAPLANILGLILLLKDEIGEDTKIQNLMLLLEKSSKELDSVIRKVADKTRMVELLDKEIDNR
jgi:PAS domain S-box-containing protein